MADLKKNHTSLHESGATAEELGKEDAVERGTKSATVAASFTTRDHDVIRTWAESRGGRPADVEGTGDKGAGVLRIAFDGGGGRDEAAGSRTSAGTPSSRLSKTATSTSCTRSAPATARSAGSTSSSAPTAESLPAGYVLGHRIVRAVWSTS